MKNSSRKVWASIATAIVVGLLGVAVATAATGATTKKAAATTTTGTPTQPLRTPETPLTGDVLAKVTAAAIAKVGGTVDAATTENDSSDANAAYEAHVTKADGTHVTVILDKSYAVLSVETGHPRGPFGHGHGPRPGETPLTGDTATKAKAAAVAKVGGTADAAMAVTGGPNPAAAYAVHVTKADGTHVGVILDKDFGVLAVVTPPPPPPGGPGAPGPPGFRRR